jgi:LPS sulfotransferase NodH
MMKRLKASSMDEYLPKLLACRTSKNGVFGAKAHFHDFETALRKSPTMLDALSPITYIFMDRRDKLAQAVSMARAMQTNSWISLAKPETGKLRYDRELISQCLGKHEMQRLGWMRWFEANDINPFVVVYEEMTANPAGVVRSILEYLDVQDDEPNDIRLPPIEKQSDDTNEEWVARFQREVEGGVETR